MGENKWFIPHRVPAKFIIFENFSKIGKIRLTRWRWSENNSRRSLF